MHDSGKTFKYILKCQEEHGTVVGHQSKLQATAQPTGDPLGSGDTVWAPGNYAGLQKHEHHPSTEIPKKTIITLCLLIISQSAHLCLIWISNCGGMYPWKDIPFFSHGCIVRRLVPEVGCISSTPTGWETPSSPQQFPGQRVVSRHSEQQVTPRRGSGSNSTAVAAWDMAQPSRAELLRCWTLAHLPSQSLKSFGRRGVGRSSAQQRDGPSVSSGATVGSSAWSSRFSQGSSTWAGRV